MTPVMGASSGLNGDTSGNYTVPRVPVGKKFAVNVMVRFYHSALGGAYESVRDPDTNFSEYNVWGVNANQQLAYMMVVCTNTSGQLTVRTGPGAASFVSFVMAFGFWDGRDKNG